MSKQAVQSKVVTKPAQRSQHAKQVKKKQMWSFPLTKKNLIIAAIGFGIILLGYALMATGITTDQAYVSGKWNNPFAITVAPFLLVIGYCVIIPFAIMKFFGNKKEGEQNPNQ